MLNKLLFTVVFLFILLSFSPFALASTERLPWHHYLLIVSLTSCAFAYFKTKRMKNIETTGLRIIIGGVYFWVAVFAQMGILLLIYELTD